MRPQALLRYVSTYYRSIPHLGTAITPNDTFESILEPLDRLLLVYTVAGTNLALGTSSLGYSLARSCPGQYLVSNTPKLRSPSTFPKQGELTCSNKSPCRRYRSRDHT